MSMVDYLVNKYHELAGMDQQQQEQPAPITEQADYRQNEDQSYSPSVIPLTPAPVQEEQHSYTYSPPATYQPQYMPPQESGASWYDRTFRQYQADNPNASQQDAYNHMDNLINPPPAPVATPQQYNYDPNNPDQQAYNLINQGEDKTLAERTRDNLVGSVTNYIEGAKQGFNELNRADENLKANSETIPTTYGNVSVPTPESAQYYDKAANNVLGETVLPTTAFIPGLATPTIATMLAKQASDAYQKSGSGLDALKAVTIQPAIDMYNNPNLAQEFHDQPLSTGANAFFAGAQALLPLYGAKKGIGKVLERNPDLPQNIADAVTNERGAVGIPNDSTPNTNFKPQFEHDLDAEKSNVIDTLNKAGIEPEKAQDIADNIINGRRQTMRYNDDVTGYQKPEYLQPTLDRAWKDHNDNGNNYSLASIDFANLGGLNKHVGDISDVANGHFRNVTDIIKQSVEDNGIKNAQFIRSGGDEFQILAPGVEKSVLDNAMQDAKMKVQGYAEQNGLHDILHPKTGLNSGIGIHFGVEDMKSSDSIADLKANAEADLSLSKQSLKDGVNNVGRGETSPSGSVPLEGQSNGIKESIRNDVTDQSPEKNRSEQPSQQVESPNNGDSFNLPKTPHQELVDAVEQKMNPSILDKVKTGLGAQDLKPLIEDIKTGAKSLTDNLSPASVNDHTRTVANGLREHFSTRDIATDQAIKGLTSAKKYWDSKPKEEQLRDAIAYQKGELNDPVLKPMVDELQKQLNSRGQTLKDMGKLDDFDENYLPQIYADTPENAKILADYKEQVQAEQKRGNGNSPNLFRTSSGFLKSKLVPDIETAVKLGIELKNTNPVDMSVERIAQEDHYIMGENIKNEFTDSGELKVVKPTAFVDENGKAQIKVPDAPEGMVRVGAPGDLMWDTKQGVYYAKPEIARLIDNSLGKGWSDSPIYQRYMATANVMNSFQLLGLFHMAKTSWETTVSKLALAPQLATDAVSNIAKGNLKGAGKNIADAMMNTMTAPTAPLEAVVKGDKFIKQLLDPARNNDPLVWSYKAGGGKIGMGSEFETNFSTSLHQALKDGNLAGASWRAPLALAEKVSSVTTHEWVPRIKAGNFVRDMSYELERDPSLINDRQRLRSVAAKIIDQNDNLMGSINWKNLFLNPKFKQTLFAIMRAPGFSGGTVRSIAGGVMDLVTSKQRMARGEKFMSQRMAYDIALPIAAISANYAMQWFQTGQQPDLKNEWPRLLYEHKNGQKDDWGNDKYSGVPSYTKDVAGWIRNPAFDTITNKAHPLISALAQILRNRDYFNTKIYNEDDNFADRQISKAKFATSQMMPFGINNTTKAIGTQGKTPLETAQNTLDYVKNASGHDLVNAVLPNIGMAPTPSSLTMTDAQKKASEIIQEKIPQGSKTQEQTDQSQLKSQLRKAVIGQTQLPESVLQAVRDGNITKDEAKKIWAERNEQPLAREVKSSEISISDVTKIWSLATDEEKEQIRPDIVKKISNVMHNEKATSEQKKQALEFFHSQIKR